MKVLKRIFITLIIVFILIIAAALVFIKTTNINKYKTTIERLLSENFGRPVGIGKLNLVVNFSGFSLIISDINVKEDPSLNEKISVFVKRISANLELLPFLRERQISFKKFNIESPEITVIRNVKLKEEGPIIQSEKNDVPITPSVPSSEQPPSNSKFPNLKITKINILNAVVDFFDEETDLRIIIKPINMEFREFTLSGKKFPVKMEAALFNEKTINIISNGEMAIDINKKIIFISNLIIESDAAKIDPGQITKSIPQLQPLSLRQFGGEINVKIGELIAGETGLLKLSGEAMLSDGSIQSGLINEALKNIDVRIEFDTENIKLNEIVFELAGGKVYGAGEIKKYLIEPEVNFLIQTENIEAEQLIPETPIVFEGKVNSQVNIIAKGFDPDVLINSLRSEGVIKIDKAKLVDFNILQLIFVKLAGIPGIGLNADSLSEEGKQRLQKKDTEFKAITANFTVSGNEMVIDDIEVQADDFEAKINGKYDILSNQIHLLPQFKLGRDISGAITDNVEELKFLAEENGQINIPLTDYSGPVENVRIYPDIQKIVKIIFEKKGKFELKKAIFKALDIENEETMEPHSNIPENTIPNTNKENDDNLEGELINKVLNAVFGN